MKFGVTHPFDCSYLPEQQERLLIYVDSDNQQAHHYSQLIQVGFRRSGEQIYRPHCPSCQACESVRIPANAFRPSRGQKRIIKRNQHFTIKVALAPDPSYYHLYERYICARHSDGSMYPPSEVQFENFVLCQWKMPIFIEAYDGNKLIAVAVTDVIDDNSSHRALSALYTFFDPDYSTHSLGSWMILMQIEQTKVRNYQFLYLGYFVEGCQKMTYKHQFHPYEQFICDKWARFDKKST